MPDYLENVVNGARQLGIEQQNLDLLQRLVRQERIGLAYARRRDPSIEVPPVWHKDKRVIVAEERVRVCKKHIENNILALGLWRLYSEKEIITALEDTAAAPVGRNGNGLNTRLDVEAAARAVDADQWNILLLRYRHGLPVAAVARKLRVSRYAVDKAIREGLVALVKAINMPIVRQIQYFYYNYLLQHCLDLEDLYTEALDGLHDQNRERMTPNEWAQAVPLPGEAVDETDDQDEIAS